MEANLIADHYRRIQEGISDACASVSRNVNEVTFIAVTKFVETERIAHALKLGIRDIGENRVQEFMEKKDFFTDFGCRTHFIGQLQTNKVKSILGQADLIQSVDRAALLSELERQARKKGIVQDILIEVNIGDEAQKGGIGSEGLMDFLEEAAAVDHVAVKGLMCIPPALDEEGARPYFAKMRELFERAKAIPGVEMRHLSMGMSGDYKAAIQEGATMVRVGSALFGDRA